MSERPRLLDAFSGAGGATRGYQLAGFHVTGVDIRPQPRYVGDAFFQGDAIAFIREHGAEYDAIHASPPCQAFTDLRHMPNAKAHDDLLTPTRALLQSLGVPYVIENVDGAPMRGAFVTLCGTMFGLGVGDAELRRHRHFELSGGWLLVPPCNHSRPRTIGVYGGHGRDRRRAPRVVGVYGHSGGRSVRDGTQQFTVAERRAAMGIDWMTGEELSQAIPPAYTAFIGAQLLRALQEPPPVLAPLRPRDGSGGSGGHPQQVGGFDAERSGQLADRAHVGALVERVRFQPRDGVALQAGGVRQLRLRQRLLHPQPTQRRDRLATTHTGECTTRYRPVGN